MCLYLATLTSIIRTSLPILVELMDLVNSYNFSISNDLTQMVNFPTQIPECNFHSTALLNVLISSDAGICSTIASPPLGKIMFMLLSQFPLTFHYIHNRISHFIALLMIILVFIGMVFMII